MDPRLADLRILRLAQMYEHAFETFVATASARYLDGPTRERLAPLQPERDQHEARVKALIERIESDVSRDMDGALARSVLLDVVEIERAAREFYLNHLDRVHDPDVARLFHKLAAEESRHVEIAEMALAALGPDESVVRESDANDIPAWEGTSDMSRWGHASRRSP